MALLEISMNRPKSLAETLVKSAKEFEPECLDSDAVDELISCIESIKQVIEQNKELLKH